jgi:hypothetical protein
MRNTSLASAHKIVIAFPDRAAALAWFEIAAADGYLPPGTDLYKADALDMGGRADPRTYLVREKGERPRTHAVRNLVDAGADSDGQDDDGERRRGRGMTAAGGALTIRLGGDVSIRAYASTQAPRYAPPTPGVEIHHRYGALALAAADLTGAPETRQQIAELRRALDHLEAALDEQDAVRDRGRRDEEEGW